MSEELVIKLLQEIRDLQKLHVESHTNALENQEESIDIQMRALRRQKITLLLMGLFLLIFLAFFVWPFNVAEGPSLIKTRMGCSSRLEKCAVGRSKQQANPKGRRVIDDLDIAMTVLNPRSEGGLLAAKPFDPSQAAYMRDETLRAGLDEYARLRPRVGPNNSEHKASWF